VTDQSIPGTSSVHPNPQPTWPGTPPVLQDQTLHHCSLKANTSIMLPVSVSANSQLRRSCGILKPTPLTAIAIRPAPNCVCSCYIQHVLKLSTGTPLMQQWSPTRAHIARNEAHSCSTTLNRLFGPRSLYRLCSLTRQRYQPHTAASKQAPKNMHQVVHSTGGTFAQCSTCRLDQCSQ
jgi:hypothetical protein